MGAITFVVLLLFWSPAKVSAADEAGPISCRSDLQMSIGPSGVLVITPEMVLSEPKMRYDSFRVNIKGRGGNMVTCADVNKTIMVEVINTYTGNKCWSNFLIEDKLHPLVSCLSDTLPCYVNPDTVDYSAYVQATDNCDDSVDLFLEYIIDDFSCDPYFSSRVDLTWTATDDQGNQSTCSSSIYFEKRGLASVIFPNDTAVSCTGVDTLDAGVPTIDGLPISGLCELISFSTDDTLRAGMCSGEYTIAREWVVTDFCRVGVSRTQVQMISVVDTTAPVIVADTLVTVGTEANSCTAIYTIPSVMVTDACGEDSLIVVTYQTFGGMPLMPGDVDTLELGRHVYMCTATDDCGNFTTTRKVVEVVDDVAPTLVCIPDLDVYLDSMGFAKVCISDFRHLNFYFDNCGIDSIGIEKMEEKCDTSLNPYPGFCVTFCCEEVMDSNLMLIITARDSSGNENFCMISTDVQDTLPPMITSHPNDTTVSCTVDYRDTAVTGGRVLFTDNCFSVIDVTFRDIDTLSVCDTGTIIRRFYVCDPMGNCDSADQEIRVVNNFVFHPDSIMWIEDSLCIENCPTSYDPDSIGSRVIVRGDSCNIVEVTWEDIDSTETPGDVCLIIERRWRVRNDCGTPFMMDSTQFIEIKNFLPPILSGPPMDTMVSINSGDSCTAQVVLPELVATDCSTGLTIQNNCGFCTGTNPAVIIGDFPVGTTTIEFIATDSCGNTSTFVTNVTVIDSVGPVLVCPLDTTVNCMTPTDTATLGSPTVSENCGGSGEVTLVIINDTIPGTCPQEFTIERTFTATDSSGNSSMCTQTITVQDTTAPVILSCPQDTVIPCESSTDTMTLGRPVVSDNCSGTVTITFADMMTPGGCANEGGITRVFTATDECGNSSTCMQIISILDTVAPTIICPPDITVECTEDVDPTNTGFPTVSDTCDMNPTVTRTDSLVQGTGDTIRTIFREWFVEDDCGNRDSCTQVILVVDNVPPTIVCPPDTIIPCGAPIDSLNRYGFAQASDNCMGAFITVADSFDLGLCNIGTITRYFTAIDSAGNMSQCSMVITLELTDTLKESGIVWPADTIDVDACLGIDPDSIPLGRPMLDTSSASCFLVSQSFTDSIDYNCMMGVCSTVVRTWTLIDSCQLDTATGQGIFMRTQLIRVVDTTTPQLVVRVNDSIVNRMDTVFEVYLSAGNVNCDTMLNIIASADDCSGIDSITNNGTQGNGMEDASGVYPPGIYPITFIAVDSCCNADTQLLVLSVLDTIRPTIQCQDALMNLSGEPPVAEFCVSDLIVSVMDNCDGPLDLTISFDPDDPNDTCRVYNCDSLNGNERITRMLTLYVLDGSNNASTCVSEITVSDPLNFCGRSLIGGSVTNMLGRGIENAQVEIPEMDEMKMTDENGSYSFAEMQNGLAYTLEVSREEDEPLDGVGIVDLILLQRHLLGITQFTSPYEYIAADANGSWSLEVSDMVQIRKLILGHIPYFVQSPTWSFVDAQYQFDPDLFPSEQRGAFAYHIDKLKSHMSVGFVGIKTGDINADAKVNSFQELVGRSQKQIHLEVHQQEVWNMGEDGVIFLKFNSDVVAEGLHLDLSYDQTIVSVTDVHINGCAEGSYEVVHDEGRIQILWVDAMNDLPLNQIEISLKVMAKDAMVKGPVQLDPYGISNVVCGDLEQYGISLTNPSSDEAPAFIVEQNRPNPFDHSTIITTFVSEEDNLTLEIFDAQGRRVMVRSMKIDPGYHNITVTSDDLLQPGMYMYKLTTSKGSHTKRMMMVR